MKEPPPQFRRMAQASDRVLDGGHGGEAIAGLLVIALPLVAVLWLMDKKIFIR